MYLPGGFQKLAAGQAYAFPVAWPSASTESLSDKLKEIAAKLDEEMKDLSPTQRVEKITAR
eukprot:8569255-Lingulodinium_polyedra.AAC.1